MASLTPIPSVSTASSETPCQSPRAATDAKTMPGLTVAASVAVTSGDSAAASPPSTPGDDNAVAPDERSEASEIAAVPLVVWEWCLVARLRSRRFARSLRVIFGFTFTGDEGDDSDHVGVVAPEAVLPDAVVENASGMAVEPAAASVLLPLLGRPLCCC